MNHSWFDNDTLLLEGASIVVYHYLFVDPFLESLGGEINEGKNMIYAWNIIPNT